MKDKYCWVEPIFKWDEYKYLELKEENLRNIENSIHNSLLKNLGNKKEENKEHLSCRCSLEQSDKKYSVKKEVEKMGLRIKKTDELTIDEFKENTKVYDEITIYLNKEKYETREKDYGTIPMNYYWGHSKDKKIILQEEVIEFFNKALVIDNNTSVPYDLIDKVIGVYYLTNGDK